VEENQNIISVRLRSGQCAFAFLVGSHGIVHDPTKNTKMRKSMHFWVLQHYSHI